MNNGDMTYLRLRVSDKLRNWGCVPENDNNYNFLNTLLGNPLGVWPGNNGDLDLLMKLDGPHGYTICKMLLMKRQDEAVREISTHGF